MNAGVKYNPERLMTVLLAPVVSEKSTFIADKHEQVIFCVLQNATKPEVKAAVELMFKVNVESVQIAAESFGISCSRGPSPHPVAIARVSAISGVSASSSSNAAVCVFSSELSSSRLFSSCCRSERQGLLLWATRVVAVSDKGLSP